MYRAQADFFKGFSNPRRIKLLKLLVARGEATVGMLAEAFAEDASTVSRYLTQLRLLGVLETRREGQVKYYWVNQYKLQASFNEFLNFLQQPDDNVRAFLAHTNETNG